MVTLSRSIARGSDVSSPRCLILHSYSSARFAELRCFDASSSISACILRSAWRLSSSSTNLAIRVSSASCGTKEDVREKTRRKQTTFLLFLLQTLLPGKVAFDFASCPFTIVVIVHKWTLVFLLVFLTLNSGLLGHEPVFKCRQNATKE